MQTPSNLNQQLHCGVNPSKSQKQSVRDSPRSYLPNPTKKQVRFSETSILLVTAPKTSCENEATWYNKNDIREFKQHSRELSASLVGTPDAKTMRFIGYSVQEGTDLPSLKVEDVDRIRGLEHLMCPDVCKVLLQRRRATIANVLEEQRRQELNGEHDAAKIALISSRNSRFAVEWRQRIATL
ncbi:hypothetical protein HJC23_013694 [Cyclotella cryptica]|uniref:Uncharacterized protein n=1 Tax=Cyclotella cryptica TaxID=29204 RepID=A0ABD3QUY6_9STRA|eukprot:CCRYP_001542-RA/>CCRYP_001542-RA protein AED:0.32 eAED:0.37 QI:0/-1/0/1/-1/0/1/0/182